MSQHEFTTICEEVYQLQVKNNPIYKKWVQLIDQHLEKGHYPFLPINQFKQNEVKTGIWQAEKKFESSSTTGTGVSIHQINSLAFYEQLSQIGFENEFGPLRKLTILALLPGYLERNNSSLVHMVNSFIKQAKSGGFYIKNFKELNDQLSRPYASENKVILFGVSHALLDFAEQFPQNKNPNLTIIETGGMKGLRKEIDKSEMHSILIANLGINQIQGEYGMTELLSQAYSKSDGIYQCPPWMKIVISDINDPFKILPMNKRGRINVIDLANCDTCSFIATDDLGVKLSVNWFKVLGRVQDSEARGCNQLYV